jgi:hypothetical protein
LIPHIGDDPLAGPRVPRGLYGTRIIQAGSVQERIPAGQVVAFLKSNPDSSTWIAATTGSHVASQLQLAAMRPVMTIGGPNGVDPAPSLEKFQQFVTAGKIHYFIMAEFGADNPDRVGETSRLIIQWVEKTYHAVVVDDVTIYDLTLP